MKELHSEETTFLSANCLPLTHFARAGGCAAKVGPAELEELLGGLRIDNPALASLFKNRGDAGSHVLNEEQTIVQSVDVISPISDDPYVFGAIAAAHALSDLYSVGAKPLLALLTLGIPLPEIPISVGTAILQGAVDKLSEAGAEVLGGHTIGTAHVELGAAVTGTADTRSFAKPGCQENDILILTKPLGTGIISTAVKLTGMGEEIKGLSRSAVSASEGSMLSLNAAAGSLVVDNAVHACTDVSGFGLIGHLMKLIDEPGLAAMLEMKRIPVLPSSLELAKQLVVPTGCDRNMTQWCERCAFTEDISMAEKFVLFDPQTSGGLLMSVAPEAAERIIISLRDRGVVEAASIGVVRKRAHSSILVSSNAKASCTQSADKDQLS